MRIVIVGAGAIAEVHARAAYQLLGDALELTVIGRSAARLERFKAAFADARVASDPALLLAEPAEQHEIAIVATPPAWHLEHVRLGLASGRHVLCEKPLVTSDSELFELGRLMQAHDRHLACCTSRYLGFGSTERVRELVRSGALGKIYHVTFVHRSARGRPGIEYQPSSHWFLSRAESGGGVLIDWAEYDFTLLNEVLGIESMQLSNVWTEQPQTALDLPDGTTFDVETHAGATLLLRTRSGASVTASYERGNGLHGGERSIVEIDGTLGSVAWDWLPWSNGGQLRVCRRFDRGGQVVSEETTFDVAAEVDFQTRPLAYLLARIRGEAAPSSVGPEALFNSACVLALYQAAATGQVLTVERGSALLGFDGSR